MTPLPNLKSLLAKLRNEARKRGLPANLMLLFYFQERFLARVAGSSYRDSLILKGGLNLYGRYGSAARPTRDVDLAGRNLSNTPEAVSEAIKVIAALELNDGVVFDTANLEAREIIESATYTGIRVELVARFEDAFETLQLDLSFGNAITPGPVELPFPSLLGDVPHSLLGYPLETIIAEKLAASIELGEGNTRLKDFYDLYWILGHETLNETSLRQALGRTFQSRGTPGDRRQRLANLNRPETQTSWTKFLRENPVTAPASFAEVLNAILARLEPLLEGGDL
jgi:predicted nucleotidyltransferase component of viral defense system